MKILKALIFSLFVVASFCVSAQNSSRGIAIARAEAVFIATANGDVAKLKQLMTPKFYKENYPYSDDEVRLMLLNVPLAKRMKLVDQIKNQSSVSTIMSRSGDVITVVFTNKNTDKDISVQLFDENEDENWKVFNYWY